MLLYHYNSGEWAPTISTCVFREMSSLIARLIMIVQTTTKNIYIHGCELTLLDQAGRKWGEQKNKPSHMKKFKSSPKQDSSGVG